MTGYVDLGADPFGRDCALDLELTEDIDGSTSTFRARRTAGQDAYHQIVEGDSDTIAKFGQGIWQPATSPDVPAPVLFFAPNFLTDGFGVLDDAPGSYCTWRLLDRVATLGADGQLVWDLKAVSVLLEDGLRNYTTDVLDGSAADQLLKEKDLVASPSERLFGTLRITKDSTTGVITMNQSYDVSYTIDTKVLFTPTQARVVETVTPS